jgi:hypothetical protein
LPREEWPENFIPNTTVKNIIQDIPEYIPMDIPSKKGGPKNINQSIHWNPLRIILLFFSFLVL